MVALGVAPGHGDSVRADVSGGHTGRAALCRVQGKAARVRKAVQNGVSGSQTRHRPAVVFLIEKKAGLLAVLKVYMIIDAVLADLGLGGGGRRFAGQGEPSFLLFQPFLEAQSLVVALVNAVDLLAVRPQDLRQQGK